jgi:hypothetical protein
MPRFPKKTAVRKKWSFTSVPLLWRVLYDGPNFIVGECRDGERKTASFFSIDAASGAVYWHEKQLTEPWWVGIEAVVNGIVLFHGYASPDRPEHKGIEACDAISGATLWSNPDLSFWFIAGDKICAYRDFFEKRVSYLLDRPSGEILEEEIDAAALRKAENGNGTAGDIQVPDVLEASAESAHVTKILGKNWEKIISETIEYIENKDYWITGFYIQEKQQKVTPLMAIVEKETGDIVYSMKLGENVPAPFPGLFFMAQGTVYCIERQHTLHAIEL